MDTSFPNIPPVVLSPAERLTLARRRRGLTQRAYADERGVSMRILKSWESGAEPCPAEDVGDITVAEWCRVTRERRGVRIAEVADDLGVSKAWVSRAEGGQTAERNLRALAVYWIDRMDAGAFVDDLADILA